MIVRQLHSKTNEVEVALSSMYWNQQTQLDTSNAVQRRTVYSSDSSASEDSSSDSSEDGSSDASGSTSR